MELKDNPNHYDWANEFCEICVKINFDPKKDQDWVATWFANAMMNGYDRGLKHGKS